MMQLLDIWDQKNIVITPEKWSIVGRIPVHESTHAFSFWLFRDAEEATCELGHRELW